MDSRFSDDAEVVCLVIATAVLSILFLSFRKVLHAKFVNVEMQFVSKLENFLDLECTRGHIKFLVFTLKVQ